MSLMERALRSITNGTLTKVVVARSIDVRSSRPFNTLQIVSSLRESAPNCTTFLIRGAADSSFLGATPEMLCRWSDSVLETEALAGSASLSLASALLQSDKENREHLAVIEGITQALGPLSERVAVEESPTLFGLRHLFHLRTAIQAQLRPGARTSEVLEALHPTPAVGGTPRDRALRFLAEHEGLERGWYGGAVGWIGEEGVELAVAIRSALIRDRWARLFVGAGVVAGSTAEGEWEETQTKALTMLAALGGSHAPD
jgi:salicylate biosynthesis isochorismate synthase/menaquinone-specific isochorismate synthase